MRISTNNLAKSEGEKTQYIQAKGRVEHVQNQEVGGVMEATTAGPNQSQRGGQK